MKKTTQKKLSAFIIAAMIFSVNAYSQIVYTDIIPDSTLAGNSTYNLDLNNDGIPDFLIAHTTSVAGPHMNYFTRISPQNGSKCSLQKLAAGDVISSSLSYSAAGNQVMRYAYWTRNPEWGNYIFHYGGAWYGSGTGYLALKLIVSGNTYYGWARLGTGTYTMQDYGYNSIPNKPIIAGETSCAIPTVTLSVSGPLSFCAGDSVTLTANGTGYLYQWKNNGINISGAISQTYIVKTAGVYKCKVTNSCGSKTSGTKTVTVPCRISDETVSDNSEQLSVYPNPAANTVNIKIPYDDAGEIQIVNLLGRVVSAKNFVPPQPDGTLQIDVSNFFPGIYVVKWSSGENCLMEKFSVLK